MVVGLANAMRAARTAIRFPLQATVTFSWQDHEGIKHDGQGQSRDISEHGVFVVSELCPPVGSRVVLRILLEEPARALRLQVNGHVLRLDDAKGEAACTGFAIMSDEAMLKENDDPVC
jgi:hypothetical protein